jgi:hypothetical protein
VPEEHGTALTDFQVEVALVFFSLPSSEGFLLAGGAALVAQRLTARPTRDLDFFTRPGAGDVQVARDEFIVAAVERGWTVEPVSDGETFCRLLVQGREELLVDFALESNPGRPSTATFAGPSFDPEELAGRKLIALFDRAAARDFVDVFMLSRTMTRETLVARAVEVDSGFNTDVLAEMIEQIRRYSDVDLALGDVDVPSLRAFFASWLEELRGARTN